MKSLRVVGLKTPDVMLFMHLAAKHRGLLSRRQKHMVE